MKDLTTEQKRVLQRRAVESQQRGLLGEQEAILLFTSFGWTAQKLALDDGEDLLVEVKDDFRASGLKFHVQVKTPENLTKAKNGSFYYEIETKHLWRWTNMIPPVFLLLWETNKKRGYWVAVPDIIDELDRQAPSWKDQSKVRVFFPPANSTNKIGLKNLRYKAASLALPFVAHNKELEVHLSFSFPSTPAGRKESQELINHFKTGEQTTISGKHLQIRTSQWYEKLYGEEVNQINPKAQLSIGPSHSREWLPMRLTILSPLGTKIAQQAISVRAVAIGKEQVRFSNAEKPTPFVFEIIARSNRHYSMSFSFENAVSSARELQASFPFFDALALTRKLRVEVLQQKNYGKEWSRTEIPLSEQVLERELTPIYRELIDDLAEIETKTGVPFQLDNSDITQGDFAEIQRILKIIRTGEISSEFSDLAFKADGVTSQLVGEKRVPSNIKMDRSEMIKFLIEFILKTPIDEPLKFEAKSTAQIQLLGAHISLGPEIMSLKGHLPTQERERLKQVLSEKRKLDHLLLELENGQTREVFSDWYIPELAENI